LEAYSVVRLAGFAEGSRITQHQKTRLFPSFLEGAIGLILRPTNLVKAIGLPFICLAMFAVAGGHWAVLQSIAWGQMLYTYSQEAGFVAGAQKTFSGEAPCSMCKSIVEAKKQEEKAPATIKVDKKSDKALVVFGKLVPLPIPSDVTYHVSPSKFFTRSEAPPTPVPIVRA
jgi:hypothetical protein